MTENSIEVSHIYKSYNVGSQDVPVLKDVSFNVKTGDFLIIYGPSGCGKSTLLHTVLGLEEPNRGKVVCFGKDIYLGTTEDDRSDFRKNHIGMIYQQPNWIKALTVSENIAFPLLLKGSDKALSLSRAEEVLKAVELTGWSNYLPMELSSGQQQKVALARAIVTSPELIIADEPTGNLDYESGQELMELLMDLNTKSGKTIVMVTHDLEYLKFAKTAIEMLDGAIVENKDGKINGKRGNGKVI